MVPRYACLAVLALLAALPAAAAERSAGLTPAQEDLIQEVRELRGLKRASGLGVTLLAEISRTMPELLWLDEMTFRNGEVWITGKAFNTEAIGRFVESLGRVREFQEPTLVEATESLHGLFSFRLSFKLAPAPPEEDAVEIRKLEGERAELRRRLARPEDVPGLVAKIRALAEKSDITIASFVEARPGRDGGVPLDVEVSRATYHGLSIFIDRLKRLPVFTRLDALTIRQAEKSQWTTGGTITASFRIRIPRRTPAE